MKTPISLTLENFRSVEGPLEFTFPDRAGLYLMRGVNKHQPRLEGNGVGKSTIWDAYFWVLTGKTPKGLKAGDVCTWGKKKGTRVSFRFESDMDVHNLVRTWGPISLTLDGDDITKEPPFLDPGPFLQCILMAQSQPMFLDMDANSKAALFSSVLELDVWDERAAKASSAASAVDAQLRVLEARESALEAEIRTLAQHDVSADAEAWEEKRRSSLIDIGTTYRKLDDQVRALQESVPEMQRQHKELMVAEALSLKEVTQLRNARAAILDTAQKQNIECERLDAIIQHSETNRKKFEGLRTCPVCLQKVSEEHKHKVSQEMTAEGQHAEDSKRALEENLNALLDEVDAADEKIRKSEEEYRTAAEKLESAEKKLRTLQHEIDLGNKELDALEDRATLLEEEINPYEARSTSGKKALATAHDTLASVKDKISQLREKHALTSMWVRGFKEVRLGLIGDALSQLEVEVNSALGQLGLTDWSILFDVDSETKSGGMKRGFAVKVLSPGNDAAVPWAAWSGGESQRLRLAAQMGLADLIRSSRGITTPLEVWDEPTTWLSPQGVTDLLDCLAERARVENRQIWVVDHRTLGYGHFTGVATLVRHSNKTTIEWSQC